MDKIIKEMSTFELGFTVTLTGIALVFAMLLLLVIVLTVFGGVSVALSKAKDKKAAKVKAEAYANMMADSQVEAPASVQQSLSAEDDDEVIAVISAAVYSLYAGSNIKPVIKSIKKSSSRRSSWAKAGISDNTRVF